MTTKRKEKNKHNDTFWKIASGNYDKVQEWPEWKQSIIISSTTASTGRFIERKSRHRIRGRFLKQGRTRPKINQELVSE